MNDELEALARRLEIRNRELAEAHSHIATLEEKLLKLKQYRRELRSLKEERRRLRGSAERRMGQVFLAPYRIFEKLPRAAEQLTQDRDALKSRLATHKIEPLAEALVDIEKDARYLPSFLKGERTLFLAQGSVDAGIDFSGLGADAVTVNPDDHSVTITLPHNSG